MATGRIILRWIRHEPALFGGVLQAGFGLLAVCLPATTDVRAAVVALGASVAVFVRAAVTPTVRLRGGE